MKKMMIAVSALFLLAGQQVEAAANDGILIVGTQAEVLTIMKGTNLTPKFSEKNPEAMVAVRLFENKMSVYEGECLGDLIKLIGKVVKGGVAITIKVGTDLWNLLNDLGCTTFNIGAAALKAACKILSEMKCIIIDGATWAVKTAFEILQCVGELLGKLLGAIPS